jgi:mannan endo-1,4-beta-mannosidase
MIKRIFGCPQLAHLRNLVIDYCSRKSQELMKNLLPVLITAQICAAFASCQNTVVQAVTIANPNATPRTVDVLRYLTNLKSSTSNKLLSGQHISHSGGDASTNYQTFIEGLNRQTRKYVSMIGTGMTDTNLSGTVTTLTNFWNAGGLVQVDAHFSNPWIADDSWVNSPTAAKPNLLELIPGETAFNPIVYARWKAQIDNTASALKQLQDRGVTVLWRPLHEMNGNWFWWGNDATLPTNTAPYIKLWQNLFNYYTQTWGLNNLLWVYSVSPSWDNSVTSFYPGNNFVDIVGMDIYSDTLAPFRASDYTDLRNLGKPMAMTESGPSTKNGTWDTQTIANAIRSYYPEFAYFLQWHSWKNWDGSVAKVALVDNKRTSGLLGDSWVVTRDEVRIPTASSASSLASVALAPAAALPSLRTFNAIALLEEERNFEPDAGISLEEIEASADSDILPSNTDSTPVPEPSSSLALLVFGGVTAGCFRRRSGRQKLARPEAASPSQEELARSER